MSKSAVSPQIKRKRGRPRKNPINPEVISPVESVQYIEVHAITMSERRKNKRKIVKADPPTKKYRKPPASRSLITPELVEELAATRAPIYAIAARIGVSEKSLQREIGINESIETALKRGRAEACFKLAEITDKLLGRDTAITAMALKQPPERGGLGWMDERSLHIEHSGEVTVRSVDGAWSVREGLIAKERKQLEDQVIEAEFSEVE